MGAKDGEGCSGHCFLYLTWPMTSSTHSSVTAYTGHERKEDRKRRGRRKKEEKRRKERERKNRGRKREGEGKGREGKEALNKSRTSWNKGWV